MTIYSKDLLVKNPIHPENKRISITQAAAICEVSTRTVQRWRKDGTPRIAEKLLQYHVYGIIPNILWHERGYHITASGELYSLNHGETWLPSDLDKLWLHLQDLHHEKATLRKRLRKAIAGEIALMPPSTAQPLHLRRVK